MFKIMHVPRTTWKIPGLPFDEKKKIKSLSIYLNIDTEYINSSVHTIKKDVDGKQQKVKTTVVKYRILKCLFHCFLTAILFSQLIQFPSEN